MQEMETRFESGKVQEMETRFESGKVLGNLFL